VFVLTSYTTSVIGGSTAAAPEAEPTSPIPQETQPQQVTGGVIVSVG